MAISILFNPMPMRLFEADGDFAAGAKGYFYLARTTTPLAVYTDAPLATPHTWPVIADAFGLFAPIYIAKGTEYKVRIEDALGNILYAADGIDNPAEATGGEGGGGDLVVTASQIAQTGDFWWQPTTAERDGWVKANGKTIGSLTSIADTKGTATATDANYIKGLYDFLWNTFPDSLCAVGTGRGANPTADWDASKTIATLDMRGYGAAGLDDMGAAAANRIQVTTTIGTTNTSTAATVPSTTGLCAGMFVNVVSGIPAGTKIASVNSATSITLSAAATVTNVSAAVRFSMFADAILAGYAGGENAHVQLVSETAAHTHANTASAISTVTDPTHFHDVTTNADGTNLLIGRETPIGAGAAIYNQTSGAAGTNDSLDVTALAAAKATGITVGTSVTMTNVAAGGGQAANLWTPTRLGTWFIKR